MNESISQRMYTISSYFGDLNEKSAVKVFGGNNKGYARIIDIKRGCSLFVVHEKDNSVTISLFVSPNAEKQYAIECADAINTIKTFFNNNLEKTPWIHCIDKESEKAKYSKDVTEKNSSEIIDIARKLQVLL